MRVTPLDPPDPHRVPDGTAGALHGTTPRSAPSGPVADPDAVGLHAAEAAGLPPGFWGATTTDAVAARLAAFPDAALPAARDALARLIATRLDPPEQGGTRGALLLARVDTALRLGRLDLAEALIDRAGVTQPALFRRAFDIGLLTGTEDRGCAILAESPGLAPSYPARIFCLARGGDWPAAAVTLASAEALSQVTQAEGALLASFLDPELAETAPAPPLSSRLTPLEWRMREAIGARPPTATLPLAFAHADLRPTAGWRARIEATERLARAGALPPERLLAIYAERRPAASGGVWDRVAAMQALDRALDSGAPEAISAALPEAWEAAAAAGLALPFAEAVAPLLAGRAIGEEVRDLAVRIALLSDSPAAALPGLRTGGALPPDLALGLVLAQGGRPGPRDTEAGTPRMARAIAAGFAADPPPAGALAQLDAAGRRGEAVLDALAILGRGRGADADDLAGALAFLRGAGLEATARRAALQILLGPDP